MMSGNLQLMVRSLGALLAVMVAVLFLPTVSSGGEGLLLGRVLVSQAKIDSSMTQERRKAPSGANQDIFCSLKCGAHEWSQLWCWDPSSEECILSDAIVTTGYQETNMADAITCYTRRIKDIVTSALRISAGKQHPISPMRVKENLLDGFYNYVDDECFHSINDNLEDFWIIIDFGSPKTFSHVMVKARNDEFWSQQLQDLEVRVGTTTVPFSWNGLDGLDLFDVFPGNATANQEIIFQSPQPVTARYVSVRKMISSASFQFCHFEVY